MAETLQMSSSNNQFRIPMPQTNTNGLNTSHKEDVLSFHNINYGILSNIHGIMKAGLNAIMGPPQSGKSLLLHILAARNDPRGLSGDVLINGAPRPTNFKCNSGYVAQDDVVMGTLTVRENLQFSAALRLPTTMTNHEKNERINSVIEELVLDKVADSKVVSREEIKKTSIGMELVTDPSILFLDEPTTGLDLRAANAVILLLKRLSEQGRTIIFSINQPQYSIFKLFDCLTLLASGKLMFHGPAQEALRYFESAGYHRKPYTNPADFFLEVINGDFSSVVLNREEDDHSDTNENEALSMRGYSVRQKLASFYVNSSFYREMKAELDPFSGVQENSGLDFKEITCVTPFCHQLRWITWRSFKNYLAFLQDTKVKTIMTGVLGLVVGLIVRWLKNDCTEIKNRAILLFLLIIFQCVTSVSDGDLFVLHEKFFVHEQSCGYYKVLSYFFGKLLAEFIPRRSLPTIVITCTLYFTAGLKLSAGAFFTMIITLLTLAYSASSLPLFMGAHRNAVDVPTLLITIYFSLMLFFSGLSLYFGNLAPPLSYVQYINIPHYGFIALQHNEFWGENYCQGLNTRESTGCQNYVICTGEEFLTIQGIDLSPWGLWMNHIILTAITIFFLIFTYIRLFHLRKTTFLNFIQFNMNFLHI